MSTDLWTELTECPTAIAVVTAHEDRLALTRAVGCIVEPGEILRVPILAARAGRVVAAALHRCPVSTLFTRLDRLTSTQVKGHVVDVLPATQEDIDVAWRGWDRFRRAVAQYGFDRDMSNLRLGADLALRIKVTQVYDQTPGPAAGRLVGRFGRPQERPASSASPTAGGEGLVPSVALAFERAFDGTIPPVFASLDEAGMPNVIHVSKVDVIDERHVALSRQFFRKTAENLARNPVALISVTDPLSNRMYILDVRHLRVETSGPLFERLATEIEAIAALMGASDVFRLEAADIFEVLAQYEQLGVVVGEGDAPA